jgi:nitroreductase
MSRKADIFNEIPDLKHVEKAIEVNASEFEKVVTSRRSTRVFTDEKIPEDIVNKCLDLALKAPNSSNLQPWDFYWVKSAEKKAKLVEYCLSQPAASTAQELIVCVARRDTWKRNNEMMLKALSESETQVPKSAWQYYKKLVPIAYGHGPFYLFSPLKKLILAFMGLKKPSPRGPSSKSDMRVWAHKSTALACENLMLSFRAYGYDSCPMEGIDEKRIKKLLGLPRGAEVCMVISAGKRADNGIYGTQIRFDRDMFIHEV